MPTTPISRASCSSRAAFGLPLLLALLGAGGNARAAVLQDGAFGDNMRLKIDSSGRVTKPGNPFFIAGHTNFNWETCAANSTWYEFAFNKCDLGTTWFNTSTGRFTAPVTGVYFFTASFYSYSSGGAAGYQHFDLGVNGNPVSGGGRYTNSYQMLGFGSGEGTYNTSHYVARIFKLNAGDYVSVYSYCSNAGEITRYGAYSYFSGALLQ